MAKRDESKNRIAPKSQQRMLKQNRLNIISETNYVIKLAQNMDSRVITLGSLIFFSTETGDAWLLDPGDNLALCLARGGDKQAFVISETPSNFIIEWNANYHIDENMFVVNEKSGRIKTILGYPTADILQATRRVASP
jgi:hypothetical protein